MKNQLIDALNVLVATPDGAPRWSAAQNLADQMGIKSILVAEADGSLRQIKWLNTDMPSYWMDEYIKKNYIAVDPAVDKLAHRPGHVLLACGSLKKQQVENQNAWSLNHGLKDVGYDILHCSRFGEAGAVGKYVTLAYEDSSPGHAEQDVERRDLFAALLATTITPDTLPDTEQYKSLPQYSLTPRQRDVLSYLAQGYQTARIAEKLGLTEATVTLHFGTARKALGANTREQALVIALQNGLISL